MRFHVIIAILSLLFVGGGVPALAATQQVGPGPAGGSVQQIGPGPSATYQPSTPGPDIYLLNPLGQGATLESFLLQILDLVIRIGTVVVILMMVYIGYKFVTARGEPGAITEAKQALLWTIVGALILLGAKAISVGILATVQALSVGK